MHLIIMYLLHRLVKCCLQENSTNFDKFKQISPVSAVASVNTLDTFLFGTFCSDPNAQDCNTTQCRTQLQFCIKMSVNNNNK